MLVCLLSHFAALVEHKALANLEEQHLVVLFADLLVQLFAVVVVDSLHADHLLLLLDLLKKLLLFLQGSFELFLRKLLLQFFLGCFKFALDGGSLLVF